MKKALSLTIGIIFLFSLTAFAVDKAASTVKSTPAKTNIVKAAKMHATGKVTEITDALIKIERTVKGDIETMALALEKPSTGINVNDSVKIEYTEKDGQLTASKVTKVTLKKKEVSAPQTKSAPVKK